MRLKIWPQKSQSLWILKTKLGWLRSFCNQRFYRQENWGVIVFSYPPFSSRIFKESMLLFQENRQFKHSVPNESLRMSAISISFVLSYSKRETQKPNLRTFFHVLHFNLSKGCKNGLKHPYPGFVSYPASIQPKLSYSLPFKSEWGRGSRQKTA